MQGEAWAPRSVIAKRVEMKMECVLGARKMLKDVGKGDGLICERGRHTVTFLEALN